MSKAGLSVIINVDGGARGNPGPAGAGVIVKDAADGEVLFAGGFFLGRATCNQAEYNGLLNALRQAKTLGAQAVEIVSDSELMVKQMNGEYRVKNEGLRELYGRANQLCRDFKQCRFLHVPREQNAEADKLVNQAINLARNVGDAAEG